MKENDQKEIISKIKYYVTTVMDGLESLHYSLMLAEEGEKSLADLVEDIDLGFDEFDKYYQDIDPQLEKLRKILEKLEDRDG